MHNYISILNTPLINFKMKTNLKYLQKITTITPKINSQIDNFAVKLVWLVELSKVEMTVRVRLTQWLSFQQ